METDLANKCFDPGQSLAYIPDLVKEAMQNKNIQLQLK